jgi:hypothetical protein
VDKPKPIHRGTVGKKGKPNPKPPLTSKKELLKSVNFKVMDDIALQVGYIMLMHVNNDFLH